MTLLKLSNIVNTHLKNKLPLSSCSTLIDIHMKNFSYKDSLSFFNKLPKRYSVDFNPYGYRRIPIYEMDHMEMLLLEWKPKCVSPIHDHHENGCIMVLLENKLIEKRYCTKDQTLKETHHLPLLKAQYIDNSQNHHSICNESKKDAALSLHLYPK